MQIKFEANQQFQISAVDSAVALFEGQPFIEAEPWANPVREVPGTVAAVANRLDLDQAALLANLHHVQKQNNLLLDDGLRLIDEAGATFPNFSIEMETGTGKTYVYIRTALELYRRYGYRKFVVVVPSVAIREGVETTLRITRAHFTQLFQNLPYRFYSYRAENLSQVRQFALSDSVELMVMTLASFNKELNVIHQATDRLQGETPVHLVQATRPILILDEPQNMESEKSVAALAALNPLLALRYSATHRNPYNLVYRLTPYDAYREGLVKRIEVSSVVQTGDDAQPYLKLDSVTTAKNTLKAKVRVHELQTNGGVKESSLTLKPGDKLRDRTKRHEYDGYEVAEININDQTVDFGKTTLRVGQELGADREAIFDAQIRETIERHIARQKKLRPKGIKVLSLFFIDRVANYADDDGIIRRLFTKHLADLRDRLPEWQELQLDDLQAAYFAQHRTREGLVIYDDSKTGESSKDADAYDLIMRDKERLLSLDEPVAFIFSHSALREGWDNPNVFQICTLNQTTSEMKKRQEIGRGVRLAVDQEGSRVRDVDQQEAVNVLTVIANESYERYVATLQSEIAEEYGPDGVPPKPANARKRATARLKKGFELKPEFRELWERIKHKTRYAVRIDTEKLIGDSLPAINGIDVRPPAVTVTRAAVTVGEDGEGFQAHKATATREAVSLAGRQPLPNIIDVMADLMEHTSPPVHLTRRTLSVLIQRTTNDGALMTNPHQFAVEIVNIVKHRLLDQLVAGIQYEKLDDWYEMSQFETEIESWEDYLVPAKRSVYDHIIFDSDVEKRFVDGLEHRQDVKLYVKLPGWFTVDTPVGEYNPDWAIVMTDPDGEGGKPLLYLVRETKGGPDLREMERRKTACGRQHFEGALGVSYKIVTSPDELP